LNCPYLGLFTRAWRRRYEPWETRQAKLNYYNKLCSIIENTTTFMQQSMHLLFLSHKQSSWNANDVRAFRQYDMFWQCSFMSNFLKFSKINWFSLHAVDCGNSHQLNLSATQLFNSLNSKWSPHQSVTSATRYVTNKNANFTTQLLFASLFNG